MTAREPALSVIIAAPGPLWVPSPALVAVSDQCRGRDAEIIVAYGAGEAVDGAIAARFPEVQFVRPAAGATLPRLLGTALARARGQVIAITDATSVVDERWVGAILEAHQAAHPVIGGAVEPDGLRGPVDWAAFFCDYAQFMLPLPTGVASEVPGNNISMKRSALARGREFVEGEFWKTYWGRRLQCEGLHLYASPAIVVHYRKSFRLLQYLVHRFHNGRCFAGMRLAELTPLRRALHILTAPALPLLFLSRILRTVLDRRRFLGQFVVAFPVCLLAVLSWSLGELSGYLRGPGTSCGHVG